MKGKSEENDIRHLWHRFMEGDIQSLADIFNCQKGKILSALKKRVSGYGNPNLHDLEDVMQDAFLDLCKRRLELSAYNKLEEPTYFFVKWAHGLYKNKQKQKKNQQRLLETMLKVCHKEISIEQRIIRAEEEIDLKGNIKNFIQYISLIKSQIYAMIIYLSYVENIDNQEIANYLNTEKMIAYLKEITNKEIKEEKDAKWVADKKYRAIIAFRKVLKDEGLLDKNQLKTNLQK